MSFSFMCWLISIPYFMIAGFGVYGFVFLKKGF